MRHRPANPATAERRRADRHRREHCPGWILGLDHTRQVIVHDLSDRGAGLDADFAIPLDAIVLVRIGLGPIRLPRRARVVRCEPIPGGRHRVGIAFLG